MFSSPQNFTPAEQLIKEREQEQFSMERQAWEQHCERLHQEVSSLTTLCNGLLRDQQMLVSTVIGRSVPGGPAASPAGFRNIPGSVGGLGENNKALLHSLVVRKLSMLHPQKG